MSIESDYAQIKGSIGALIILLGVGALMVVLWDVLWLLIFVWLGFRPYRVSIMTSIIGTILVIPVFFPLFLIIPISDPFLETGTHPIIGAVLFLGVMAILLPTLWMDAQAHR